MDDYWKVEAQELGFTSARIDHLNPNKDAQIYLMEERGEL